MSSDAQPSNPEALWPVVFDDGNLIIGTEGLPVRVHNSVLSRRSPVFKNIWNNRPDNTVSIRIHISESEEDIVNYVKSVYNINSDIGITVALNTSFLASLMRTSRKFGDTVLRMAVIQRLSAEFPMTVAEWDQTHALRMGGAAALNRHSGLEFDLLDIVNINDLQLIKPALLLHIAGKFTPAEILNGIMKPNGLMTVMTEADQERVIQGMKSLRRAAFTFCFWWAAPDRGDRPRCTSPEGCAHARDFIFNEFLGPWHTILPFDKWRLSWSMQLCSQCGAKAQFFHRQGRRRLWSIMPAFFDLVGWNRLAHLQSTLSAAPYDINYRYMV